jgi:predicted nucleotide-binding protein
MKEGETYNYDNFSPKGEYGYPAGLTPKYAAWRTKAETLLYTTFGKDSRVYQVYQRGASVETTGWGPDHFTEAQGFVLGSLQAAIDELESDSDHDSNNTTALHSNTVFVVHGHDELAKQNAARLLERIGLHPIILHEQPSGGSKAVIEKLEANSDVGFAVVLLTPDDLGRSRKAKNLKPRARQNVILELGYFMGKLRRGKVCALYKEGVEIPSDYQGVLYIPIDSAGAWRMQLAKEIKNAGIDVDLNKL